MVVVIEDNQMEQEDMVVVDSELNRSLKKDKTCVTLSVFFIWRTNVFFRITLIFNFTTYITKFFNFN